MNSISNQRRKIVNLILNRKQLRQLLPFGALAVLNLVLCGFMYWLAVSAHQEVVVALTPDQAPVLSKLYEADGQLLTVFVGGSLFTIVLAGLFWLLYSHRVSGPVVQLTRQIDNMIDGHFEEVHLRQKDQLKEVADGLNRLSEKLSGRVAGK